MDLFNYSLLGMSAVWLIFFAVILPVIANQKVKSTAWTARKAKSVLIIAGWICFLIEILSIVLYFHPITQSVAILVVLNEICMLTNWLLAIIYWIVGKCVKTS